MKRYVQKVSMKPLVLAMVVIGLAGTVDGTLKIMEIKKETRGGHRPGAGAKPLP